MWKSRTMDGLKLVTVDLVEESKEATLRCSVRGCICITFIVIWSAVVREICTLV